MPKTENAGRGGEIGSKVHCTHLWNYHNGTLLCYKYMLIKIVGKIGSPRTPCWPDAQGCLLKYVKRNSWKRGEMKWEFKEILFICHISVVLKLNKYFTITIVLIMNFGTIFKEIK
jgi:hypothetical protein